MTILQLMTAALCAAAGLAPGAALAQAAPHAQADGQARAELGTHYRLFVGDHGAGVVRALDLANGASAGTFALDQSPALTRSASGRTVFAVQGEAGKVAVIATGVSFEDHGDHGDLHVAAPELLPVTIEGAKPAHVVEDSGRIALFDDGTGAVSLFAESAVLDKGASFEPRVLQPGAAHHGLAAPMGDFLVVSVPGATPDDPRLGLKVLDKEGETVGAVVDCPGVHGQAQSARTFAFGCKDGIVVATPGGAGEPPRLEHVSTAALGEGNVSTLKGGTTMQFFLGNYGPQAVVIIEPGAAEPFRKVELPTRRVDFALDPAEARNAYILTEDGRLHRLDVVTGRIEQSVALTEPYSMDGHWRDPRPRLAVAGDHLAVTDPSKGLVRIVSTDRLAQERTIPVEGVPYTIVAVGGSGAVH
ncbi:metallochaperone AztD [Antarcticirhabdus aurantiaca]|uniref:Metallochaperone AztD n=1 Tax=Antarcticirhabdus aurantiaca TaxID=2606717 RepID=A0ACD4NM04_9HYPH|nr:metallochaperone AztD [Antarcticirhabdus aurantiaca]WAJ27778.1 metallochaperone AztD [Jeongeuplla avenae]